MSLYKDIIEIEDYKRIFETIYSILRFIGKEQERNCTYFSLIGALLLSEHNGISAKSFSGVAAYMLNDELNTVLGFAEQVGNNKYIGSENGFHSWVESGNFIIDFQAPLFPEMCSKQVDIEVCGSKMFQKHISFRCESPMQIKKTGDFFHSPNLELTKHIIDILAESQLNMNILNICNNWYVNPIHKMKEYAEVKNGFGQNGKIPLYKKEICGKW